jgi:hypothetical protein
MDPEVVVPVAFICTVAFVFVARGQERLLTRAAEKAQLEGPR